MKFIGVLTLSMVIQSIRCFPYGAPTDVCVSMAPVVYQHQADFQTTAAPFDIHVDSSTYTPGQTVQGKND